jgi:hypothetical protein
LNIAGGYPNAADYIINARQRLRLDSYNGIESDMSEYCKNHAVLEVDIIEDIGELFFEYIFPIEPMAAFKASIDCIKLVQGPSRHKS